MEMVMEEIKLVLFQEDEREYRGLSIIIEYLKLFFNQNSDPDVPDNWHELWKRIVCIDWKFIYYQLDGRMRELELKKSELENRGISKEQQIGLLKRIANNLFEILD